MLDLGVVGIKGRIVGIESREGLLEWARQNAVQNNDHTREVRAWKLFLLLPFMLLPKKRSWESGER